MTGLDNSKGGPFSALTRMVKEAIRHEKMTTEGVTNIVVLGMMTVALIAVPLLSGTSVKWGPDGFELTIGDATGSIGLIVFVGIVCLAFVGGTNYLRIRGRL